MITPARTRRRRDRIAAAAVAIIVVVVAGVVWLTSDIRATTSLPGPAAPIPTAASSLPSRLLPAWTAGTDAELGAAVSPYGVVVTTDGHTVTGHDATTGATRWRYGRSNVPLCAVGSGDTAGTDAVDAGGRVRGFVAVYEKNGLCSQVQELNPVTGARLYARTSPGQAGGSLVFGGPYVGWVGPTLMELWRSSLVRTIQYGDQPTPTNPNTRHLGCTYSDMAVADDQFATVEHCTDKGANARLVINYTDPNTHDSKKNEFQHDPRAEFDTGSRTALLVGITRDRAAVVVSQPTPAVVIYDADGTEVSRNPVSIPAAEIDAAVGITPAVVDDQTPGGNVRYSLIGRRVIAVGTQSESVTVTVTPTTSSGAATTGTGEPVFGTPATTPSTETQDRDTPTVSWVADGALGLPAIIDGKPLLPVAAGLVQVSPIGAFTSTITVDRKGYVGRVDAVAVGGMIIETRGGTVVGLKR